MPILKLLVDLEVDGVPLAGFPIIRRLTVDEMHIFDYEKVDDPNPTTFTTLPADQLAEIQALLVRSDKTVTVRLDGQTDAGIVINPGGLILLLDVDIDAGAGAPNAKINNDSGVTAIIRGLAAGT